MPCFTCAATTHRSQEIGAQTPSSASKDYGRPFAEIFAGYDHDFYKIDPHLFSPAVVTFVNIDTGNSFRFGKFDAAGARRVVRHRLVSAPRPARGRHGHRRPRRSR